MTCFLLFLIGVLFVAAVILNVQCGMLAEIVRKHMALINDRTARISALSARLNDTERAFNHRLQELETEFDAFNELRIESLFDEVLGDDQPFEPDTDMED